jgi:Lon protease-like protein
MSCEPILPDDFTGFVRLFPLPNLVLFPHVMQPLHVFEPRYRKMTEDALAGDRLLTLALLKPGWEGDYQGRPTLHAVVCIGRIIADQRLADGRFNLLVRGLSRARIAEELPCDKSYRCAQVELLPDILVDNARRQHNLRRQLVKLAPALFPAQNALLGQLQKLLKSNMPLGALCDIIAFALPLDVEVKQELLEEVDVEIRARRLLKFLRARCRRTFPPEFSLN